MSTADNGGPAFPYITSSYSLSGMTLRDYFAAKALQALVSLPASVGTVDSFAVVAYRYADAMLLARSTDNPIESTDAAK